MASDSISKDQSRLRFSPQLNVTKIHGRVSTDVQLQVFAKSRRRCALCYGFDFDMERKKGQLAHVDRNASNSGFDNAAFLCLLHHDEYDTAPSQTKRLQPEELRKGRDELYEVMANPLNPASRAKKMESGSVAKNRKRGGTLEVYNRRIPYYYATRDFVQAIVAETEIDLQTIFKFTKDTDEALFLFDELLAEYLGEVYNKAVRFRRVNQMLNRQRRSMTSAHWREKTNNCWSGFQSNSR